MPIQNNDLFLVSRNRTNYKIEAKNLMTVQDTDLFLVRRGSTNYKVPASELRKYFGAEDFIVEMWGRGFPNQQLAGNGGGASAIVVNGGGGYTRLSMKIPSSYTLQIRPIYYAGGTRNTTQFDSYDGGASTTTSSAPDTGGAAAGIGINDIWLAVVGGGGLGRYSYGFTNSFININGNTPYFYATNSSLSSGTGGKGGYNLANPTAEPGIGASATSDITFVLSSVAPGQIYTSGSGTIGGEGGGGAPGGAGISAGQGGGANIRIWYEKQIVDGYLNSFPDIRMTYTNSSDGSHFSAPKVRITSRLTDNFIEYTTNQDVLVSDLITQLVG